jgi:hypothetical protein
MNTDDIGPVTDCNCIYMPYVLNTVNYMVCVWVGLGSGLEYTVNYMVCVVRITP